MTMKEQSRGEAIDYLRRHKESLSRQGYLVHTQLIENESPAEAILITVEEQDMDMVVMSTHGRGGVTRWVYGSVADKVLRHSDIPVLLIRTQKAKMPAT